MLKLERLWSRSSTRNFAGWPGAAWQANTIRLCKALPWCMRPIFGWWGKTRCGWRTALTSLALPPASCAKSSSIMRRMHGAAKRGANCLTLALNEAVALPQKKKVDLVALDDALNGLATLDLRQSQIVDLRFFGGLSIEDASCVLGISPSTVKREWATARLWLQREMSRGESA